MTRALAKVYSAELEGIEAKLVEVEVDLNIGLHAFNIVGLADKALSEAKERVGSAIKNTGFKSPSRENRKITVNLAPADLKKAGTQYDLAIAIGYLAATKQVGLLEPQNKMFFGELALDGRVRKIPGGLNTAILAKELCIKELFLPTENAREASFITDVNIVPVETLSDLINHLEGRCPISSYPATEFMPAQRASVDINDVRGQRFAKRALTVAAAGGHNILMSGPPGSGKTMLANSMISILPPLDLDEAMEVSRVWSSVGLLKGSFASERPFRSPHQTASPVAIMGGGTNPKAGEISLAHRGILFLDELPEFRRDLLEALRQPMESGEVVVSRISKNLTFPAKFILIAAMNPCPCGFWGDNEKECRCTANEVYRYQKRVSGPLLDRIDIQINVPRIKLNELNESPITEENQTHPQKNVRAARRTQKERFQELGWDIKTNSEMSSKQCEQIIRPDAAGRQFLQNIFDKSLLSTRSYYRILKVARTIADLEAEQNLTSAHLAEAFQLRIREA
ncbi:MAG: YifB family Mg chelatase-like AAA ATPase [Candidatus Colwellbacteria bacterium]|nr:YifB family Mg chelatase-like AAA ATPase [Candidatus Colwellbacteria bacterium]